MTRQDGRTFDQMRPVTIETGYLKYPHGSALIAFGDTKVICTVTVDEKVPPFLLSRPQPQGWLTCEYALMPAAGLSRNQRAGYGNTTVKGRVHEIQRMVGRALRAAIDLKKVGSRTLQIDCDVLQADGGTRTASVTGAMVALEIAVNKLMAEGKITENPLLTRVAAVSVGLHQGNVLLDLDYKEDSAAETDLNIVMTSEGGFIEVQGTAEKGVFSAAQLSDMLKLGETGIKRLFELQTKAIERARR
ncbi:MAG: ribonuclease PH [Candidatus Riflebacteria bacterium]|nr:ribonuclease PH [Candidatus Riflebacteria bacterium]